MEALLAKLRDKSLSESQTKAASDEYDGLRQAALGVPEIAALLVNSPAFAESVSANDLAQIKQGFDPLPSGDSSNSADPAT
jgi:hypothetical protein